MNIMNKISQLLQEELDRFPNGEMEENLPKLAESIKNEKTPGALLSRLLLSSMLLSNADGGTIYVLSQKNLKVLAMYNRSLNIEVYENLKEPRYIPLFNKETGMPNEKYVSVHCFIIREPVYIDDVHTVEKYDTTGSKSFDKLHNYHSKSMLSIPLMNDDNMIGVLQLINAKTTDNNQLIAFSENMKQPIEMLAKECITPLEKDDAGEIICTNADKTDPKKILQITFVSIIGISIIATISYFWNAITSFF